MAYTGKPAREFIDLPLVQAHLRTASKMVGEQAAVRFLESTDGCLRYMKSLQFDSPLEVLFWMWWSACEVDNRRYPYDCVYLERQVEVVALGERFRLDFVVSLSEPHWQKAIDAGLMLWPKIAVEVDGHTFHERTPEQVALRDRRDRCLQQEGWQIFHFSYSEFTKHPQDCVVEVYDIATTRAVELYRQFAEDIPPEFHAET